MRQVPQKNYLLIGGGKLARHLQFYFSSLGLSLAHWSRNQENNNQISSSKQCYERLKTLSGQSDIILLAISDSSIEPFVKQNSFLKNKTLVHFSGCLTIDGILGVHPLMTFSEKLYDADFYKSISFITDESSEKFQTIFNGLPNPVFQVSKQEKAFYHSLCVMSGNFTVLLWNKLFSELNNKFQVPKEAALPYFEAIQRNILENHEKALTGPLARGDQQTITKNLAALENDPFEAVYKGFVETYEKITSSPTDLKSHVLKKQSLSTSTKSHSETIRRDQGAFQ